MFYVGYFVISLVLKEDVKYDFLLVYFFVGGLYFFCSFFFMVRKYVIYVFFILVRKEFIWKVKFELYLVFFFSKIYICI